jgi:hypothetical protein
MPATVGIRFYLFNHLTDLIYRSASSRWPSSPLDWIDLTEVSLFIRPFVPDGHFVLFEISNVS